MLREILILCILPSEVSEVSETPFLGQKQGLCRTASEMSAVRNINLPSDGRTASDGVGRQSDGSAVRRNSSFWAYDVDFSTIGHFGRQMSLSFINKEKKGIEESCKVPSDARRLA